MADDWTCNKPNCGRPALHLCDIGGGGFCDYHGTPGTLTYSGDLPSDPNQPLTNSPPVRTQGMCWQHGGYDAGDVAGP